MLKAANFSHNSGNLNVSTLDIQTTYEIQNNGGAISANILSIAPPVIWIIKTSLQISKVLARLDIPIFQNKSCKNWLL